MKTPTIILTAFIGLLLSPAPLLRAEDSEPPVPVRMVAPDFPPNLKRSGVSGIVTVSCLVDQKGDVQEVSVEKASDEGFVQAALEAVKKWKFKPAKKDGVACAIRVS